MYFSPADPSAAYPCHIYTYKFQLKKNPDFSFLPGQFNMIGLPRVGELASAFEVSLVEEKERKYLAIKSE